MKITGTSRLRSSLRWLRNKISAGSIILLYHRVAEVDNDPWSLSVTPQNFAEQLQVLQKYTSPIKLQHLVQALRAGKRLHRSVVITFDDGYIDNLQKAKPLLERYDIPATVFVATGYMGQQHEFWWDELENLLLQPRILPTKLCLTINGNIHTWDLGEAANYSENFYKEHRRWKIGENDPTYRHFLFRSLRELLCPLVENERRKVLDELQAWTGYKTANRSSHLCMSPTEVLALQEGGLIEVGSHGVTHPLLPALPVDLQRDEIEKSKFHLEEILGYPITSFAHPYGEYTIETSALVKDAGFASACAWYTGHNIIGRDTDCFQLPRIQVQDWNGEEFARHLSRCFDD